MTEHRQGRPAQRRRTSAAARRADRPHRRLPQVHQPAARAAVPVRPVLQRVRAGGGPGARRAAWLLARGAAGSAAAIRSIPAGSTRCRPPLHRAAVAVAEGASSWNPLNPLYYAVAWVITRIHAGLSSLFGPTSGLAWVADDRHPRRSHAPDPGAAVHQADARDPQDDGPRTAAAGAEEEVQERQADAQRTRR